MRGEQNWTILKLQEYTRVINKLSIIAKAIALISIVAYLRGNFPALVNASMKAAPYQVLFTKKPVLIAVHGPLSPTEEVLK